MGTDPTPSDSPNPPEEEKHPAWIDRLVSIATALGMNGVRVRWKLTRWHNQRQAEKRLRERRREQIRYAHKTCDHCGAVQDRDARVCGSCGGRISSRTWQLIRRLGITSPQVVSVSFLIGTAAVLVYGRVLLSSPANNVIDLDIQALYRFGGHWPPAVAAGEWWRLSTAIFLHASLWHIGFNLFALTVIGPHIEETYGRWVTLFLFMLTGVVANIGSAAAGLDGLGIGASGGIMGLVGVAAGYGHKIGTPAGEAIRNDMLKWSAYVFLFGFFIGADNWAHLFGLLSGGAIGYTLNPRWLRTQHGKIVAHVTGAIGLVTAAATVAFILIGPS